MKITLNGIALNYVERGIPQGLPVVFIHGFPFNHEMWNPQMKALPNNIRAISYDVRGHGASDVGDAQYSIEFFVDDLIALLDHLVIDRAVLCGLSMGGYIALRAFERHPDRVRALVLCNTRSEADSNEAKVRRSATIRTVKTAGVKIFSEDFLKSVFTPESIASNAGAVDMIRRIILNNSPLGICGTVLALAARTDTTSALGSISVPTLLIGGEQDTLTPPADLQHMHDRIRGSEIHILPHAAHLSNLENAPAFNDVLIKFLKRIP